jgi:hypothetical protein
VLLIAFGIQMIFAKSKAPLLAYLSSLLIIAAAVYAVVPYWDLIKNPETEKGYGRIEKILSADADTLEIRAHFNHREFTLDDFDKPGFEMQYSRESSSPQINLAESGNIATLHIDHLHRPWMRFIDNDDFPYWKLEIGRQHPLDLFVDGKRSYCYLRLADFKLNSLDLECDKCYEVVVQFGADIPKRPINIDLYKSDLRVEVLSGYEVMLKEGTELPFYVIDHLGFSKLGRDLVSDTIYHPDSLLILDIKPQIKNLQINWYD